MSIQLETKRELDAGDIHEILRNDRRREVLNVLKSNGGVSTLRELSEYIAALESDENPPPRNVRQSVYVSLHQTHLPKLDKLDIVAYDTGAKTVELQVKAGEVQEFMDDPRVGQVHFLLLYLGIGLLGTLAMGSAVISGGLPSFEAVIVSLLLFGVLTTLTVYHLWMSRCSLA